MLQPVPVQTFDHDFPLVPFHMSPSDDDSNGAPAPRSITPLLRAARELEIRLDHALDPTVVHDDPSNCHTVVTYWHARVERITQPPATYMSFPADAHGIHAFWIGRPASCFHEPSPVELMTVAISPRGGYLGPYGKLVAPPIMYM